MYHEEPLLFSPAAALQVARKERWRREALWQNVRQLSQELGIEFRSPICPIVIGGAEEALAASRFGCVPLILFVSYIFHSLSHLSFLLP